MQATMCTTAAPVMAQARPFTGLRPLPAARPCMPAVAARRPLKVQRKSTVAVQASSAVEVAQVAVDTGLIFGSAAVMVGITLVGLAIGFVLLRVESLAEEGKI